MNIINNQSKVAEREYLTAVSYESLGLKEKQIKKKRPVKDIFCKHCLSLSYEILWGKSFGNKKAWDMHKHPRDIFKLHCLKCNSTYFFKPDKPSQALKAAKNKTPYVSYAFKKRYILLKAKELKALRKKKKRNDEYKRQINSLEVFLGQFLEINIPMQIDNWLMVKDKNGQVKIYPNKDVYYKAEKIYKSINNQINYGIGQYL